MFATNILVTKAASNRLNVGAGFVISVTVNLLFAMLVFAVELGLRRETFRWDVTGVLLFMLAGACSTYLGRWFFFGAIARLGAAKASLFHVSSPAFTVIVAWLFLGEALPLSTLLAIIATIVGLFLVSTPPGVLRARPVPLKAGAPIASVGTRWKAWLASGFAVGIGATLAYSVGNVLRGASVRQWNEPVAGAMLGAVAALALHLVIGSGHRTLLRELLAADRTGLRLYALGGVLTISAQICMIASMRHIPVAVATVITLCTPLVVIPASYWLMKNQERIGPATLIGAAVTMAGIAAIVLR
jgi:uncharacterized membrane protein